MVFVTGGTGLVGSRLIFDLVNKGEDVTALIRHETSINKFISLIKYYTDKPNIISDKINWVRGDLLDIDTLFEVIPNGASVFHCAAEVSFNPKDKDIINDINISGTANIVDVCLTKNINKLCYVSSIGALGRDLTKDTIDEDTPWNSFGKSVYSLSKYYAEIEVWRGSAEGLNVVIVNPAVILGAGNWQKGSSKLYTTVHNGIKYYTLGTTGYVDVRDVTKVMILLMDLNIFNERFILSAEVLSFKQLFTKIAKSINIRPPHKYASPLITNLAYKLDYLKSLIFKTKPQITKQVHKMSHSKNVYISDKIKNRLDFIFKDIDDTINFIGECYKR